MVHLVCDCGQDFDFDYIIRNIKKAPIIVAAVFGFALGTNLAK
jgi:hypothetical protein